MKNKFKAKYTNKRLIFIGPNLKENDPTLAINQTCTILHKIIEIQTLRNFKLEHVAAEAIPLILCTAAIHKCG